MAFISSTAIVLVTGLFIVTLNIQAFEIPIGFIPRENIIGRPLVVYWSFKTPPGQWRKTDLGDRVAFLGHVALHFFDETRWKRMLHPVR